MPTAPRPAAPAVVDRAAYQAEVDRLRVQEKAHSRAGDALAATRRRLPMVDVDPTTPLTGPDGPTTLLDAFEGRRQLLAYWFMWWDGHPAAEQCEGCSEFTAQAAGDRSLMRSRDVTWATFCQGPYEESARYRAFMGWDVPWYSVKASADALLAGREAGRMYLISYLRRDDRVYETYWTTVRGVEAMDFNYRLLDLTVYGRQEPFEDSPPGWPQEWDGNPFRSGPRPIVQWPRIAAGCCDDLGVGTPS